MDNFSVRGTVELDITAVSKALKNLQVNILQAFNVTVVQQFNLQVNNVTVNLNNAANAAHNMASNVNQINGSSLKLLSAGAKTASTNVNGLSNNMKKLAGQFNTFENGMRTIQGLAAANFLSDVIGGIAGVGMAAVTTAAQFRQYEIAFQTMLKDTEAGTKMFQELQDFATRTPFDVQGVVSAGQKLMAFGFQANEIIPILTTVGDAASALGAGSVGITRITYALGQMRQAGKLNAQDMMQLSNAGIGAWQMLADYAGMSVQEIRDASKKGMIDSAAAVDVILAGMQKQYGGMMAKANQEVYGEMQNLKEVAEVTFATIGGYITDAFNIKGNLKSVIDGLTDFETKMIDARKHGASFTDMLRNLIPPEIAALVGALAGVLSGLLVGALIAATSALVAFAGLSAPFVAALAVAGAAVATLAYNFDKIPDGVKEAGKYVVEFGGYVLAVVGTTKALSTVLDIAKAAAKALGVQMVASGTAAQAASALTVTSAGQAIPVLTRLRAVIWSLAGGWLGVASAITVAFAALVKYQKQKTEEEYVNDVVGLDGKTYKYDRQKNQWYERQLNSDASDFENPYTYNPVSWDDDRTAQLVFKRNQQNEKANEGDKKTQELQKQVEAAQKAVEDNTKASEDIKDALNGRSLFFDKAGGGKGSKAKADKTYKVDTPVGEIAAQNAIDTYMNAPGSQWLNSDLTSDLSNSCASFVATMWRDAGVNALYTASGHDMDQAFKDVGAWHPSGDKLYTPEAGDYISGPEHVGMYVGNNQVISRDSAGGLQQRSLEDWKNTFGFEGIGSIREFTGGQTVQQDLSESSRAAQQAMDKLARAKDEAIKLFRTMSAEIGKETGTAYETAMASIEENVQGKAQQIQKMAAAGLPQDSVDALTGKLGEYKTVLQSKVTDEWQKSMTKVRQSTAQMTAQVTGDYKTLADIQYENAVKQAELEEQEQIKKLSRYQGDVEALKAAEDEKTAKVLAAEAERARARRDFESGIKTRIDNGDIQGMRDMLNSSDATEYFNWDAQTKGAENYYSTVKNLREEANKSWMEMQANIAEGMQNSLSNFFTSIIEGQEYIGDIILDFAENLMDTIIQQFTEKWAAQIVTGLFGMGGDGGNGEGALGALTSMMNGASGGDNTGFSGIGGMLLNNAMGLSGGGEGEGGNALSVAADSLITGINSTVSGFGELTKTASTLTGTTSALNGITGAYNTVQTTLATTTKPAEATSTATVTGAMTALQTSAYMAAAALKAVSASKWSFLAKATGGYITGPGSGTSDSIPAALSNGEYVIRASAVRRIGTPVLDAINSGKISHFATGGSVGGKSDGIIALPSGGNVTLNVSAMDAGSFRDALRNGFMDEIKQMLADGDREFTSMAGVW